VHPGARVAASYSLTVHQDFKNRGAAVTLKRAQLAHAKAAGCSRMEAYMDGSQQKYVEAAMKEKSNHPIALARKAAAASGFDYQLVNLPGNVSTVISLE